MANYLPTAYTMYRLSKKSGSSSKGSNSDVRDDERDKGFVAIMAIAFIPGIIAAIAFVIASRLGIMTYDEAVGSAIAAFLGWPILTIMQILIIYISWLVAESDAAPLVALAIMDALLAVVYFAVGVPLPLLLIVVTVCSALQLALAELTTESVSWLISMLSGNKKEEKEDKKEA